MPKMCVCVCVWNDVAHSLEVGEIIKRDRRPIIFGIAWCRRRRRIRCINKYIEVLCLMRPLVLIGKYSARVPEVSYCNDDICSYNKVTQALLLSPTTLARDEQLFVWRTISWSENLWK